MRTYTLCVVIDNKQLASGEKREDFATDAEAAAYWLGFCRDACSRAAEKRHAKRVTDAQVKAWFERIRNEVVEEQVALRVEELRGRS